ncbi:MAG: ABC transporter substrate-binding protein [Candidatus Cloacimonetes bacterium]|nr:ABC transporter substrate-binding protein [Candidatus Cloacimonadota bacterium]MBL7086498.1 ABC transporter substrate-binding protein [Candidatus Cloacimonadota bacterium]
MKKAIIITLIGVLIISSFVFIISCSKKEKVIKIGSVLPLTGDIAVYGKKMKQGIDLAKKEINSKGGINGRLIKLIYEDDKGDAKESVSAVNKLINTDQIEVIIGGAISSTALATVPIIDKNEVVLFSPAATNPKLSGMSRFFFRNWPSDVFDGTAMGQFASKELNLKNIAVLYVNNDWGLATSDLFIKTFEKNGGKIVIQESFEPNNTDFKAQITKIKNTKPDALYLIAYQKEIVNILKQKVQIGLSCRLLSTYGFFDPEIIELTGNATEGTIITAPSYDSSSDSEIVKMYVESFKEEFGEVPDIWSAQAYDALNILALAISRNKTNSSIEIRDIIAKIKNYNGVSGKTSFDENGDVYKPLRFLIVKNGEFVNYGN